MSPIPLKRIISVSSEDKVHLANNLLSPASGLYWLSSTEHKIKYLTVELEMAKLAKIAQIEVGNSRSAFVEVLVSDSYDSSGHTNYVSLLPQSILMTAEESKNGRNTTRTKVFGQDKLSRSALDKKWRYIKIQCLQPYLSDRPYGLRYIKFFQTINTSDPSTIDSPSLSIKTPPSGFLTPTISTHPKSYSTPHHQRPRIKQEAEPLFLTPQLGRNKREEVTTIRTPKLPSLSVSSRGNDEENSFTPKRPRKVEDINLEDDSQEFEFAGLENQSRLLKNTLKGDSNLIESNPLLSRIANERKKAKEEKKDERGMSYVRRKLLHKELKPIENESVDFLSSYSNEKSASIERSQTSRMYTSMKLSKLDNRYEMGDESSPKKRYGSRRSGGAELGGDWIKRRGKRKRKEKGTPSSFDDQPVEFIDVFPTSTSKQTTLANFIDIPKDSSIADTSTTSKEISDVVMLDNDGPQCCPICNELIPVYALELHASVCAEQTYDNNGTLSTTTTTGSSTNESSSSRAKFRPCGIVYID